MTRTLPVLAVLVCGWACSESVTTGVIVPEPVQTDLGMPDAVPAPVDAAPMADAVVSQRVYFVSPSGDDGGDGRRRSPFTTRQAAYDVAQAGDVVQLLPGRFDALGTPPDGVVIRGVVRRFGRGRTDRDCRPAHRSRVVAVGGDPTPGLQVRQNLNRSVYERATGASDQWSS